MPIKPGMTIAAVIREFHGGDTYARTARKFGKARADKQAVAVAYANARRSKRKTIAQGG